MRNNCLSLIHSTMTRGAHNCGTVDSMNYELAKKLKDAGFPLRRHYEDQECCESHMEIDGVDYIIPDLPELIEACGEADVFELHRENNKWGAYVMDSNGKHSFKTRCCGEGTTPEEAVANLWLALHEPT